MLGCRRNEIDLCGRLLGVAAEALGKNPGLLLFVIGFKLVLILLVLPIFVLMFFAYSNGSIVPNGVLCARILACFFPPSSFLFFPI